MYRLMGEELAGCAYVHPLSPEGMASIFVYLLVKK